MTVLTMSSCVMLKGIDNKQKVQIITNIFFNEVTFFFFQHVFELVTFY